MRDLVAPLRGEADVLVFRPERAPASTPKRRRDFAPKRRRDFAPKRRRDFALRRMSCG